MGEYFLKRLQTGINEEGLNEDLSPAKKLLETQNP
jgi:hypothetical protein